MKSVPEIQVQKLFILALVLKVTSSFLGWYFVRPWSLGFSIPIAIMGTYIVLGYFRRNTDVTDEKFADTCYYLGFIFTITSIIFSLFDLPNIGTRIQDIAVRFGAAMVSTVLGLSVRVYLVSFKQDVGDALTKAEDAVLDAARKFAEQLTIAVEKLRVFETQVDDAAKSSVERVNLQIESLSKNYAEKLADFFTDLTAENQKAFTAALAEVKTASGHLANSVDGYSQGMRSNLSSIETKVDAFTNAVTNRLKTTTFPDDYFAKNLEAPLAQLLEGAKSLAGEVKQVSSEVNRSSTVLSGTLTKIREKANATEGSLDSVLKLTLQQQAVLDSAQGQLTTIGQLANSLTNVDTALTNTLAGISASNLVTSELTTRVSSVVEEAVIARQSLEESLAVVVGKLESNASATNTVASKLEENATANRAAAATIAEKLDASSLAAKTAATMVASQLEASTNATGAATTVLSATATASELIVQKLDGVRVAEAEASVTLGNLGLQAVTAVNKVDQAVEQLQVMVQQLSSLDSALRSQSSELKGIANQIKGVKVVVELKQPTYLSPSAGSLEAPEWSFVAPTSLIPEGQLTDVTVEADDEKLGVMRAAKPLGDNSMPPSAGA